MVRPPDLPFEICGTSKTTLVLVHGAWVSRRSWDPVVPALREEFRVLTYDRRGHGDSPLPRWAMTVASHTADLAGLLEHQELAPAWLVGNSSGGIVALRLASERPDLVRGVIAHEPPLFSVLDGTPDSAAWLAAIDQNLARITEHIDAGEHARAARLFMEGVTGGPGAWDELSPQARQRVAANAPAFLAEGRARHELAVDLAAIAACARPILFTQGGQSPPPFAHVIERLREAIPHARLHRFEAAGHLPHRSKPEAFVEAVRVFVQTASTADASETPARRTGGPAGPPL